jgi:hypothetical protein
MSGLEVANSQMSGLSVGGAELLSQRQQGMQRSKDIIYEQIANHQFPIEEQLILRGLEKRADGRLRQTYYEGNPVTTVSETGIVPRIGMTFMAGADAPQVNRMEQIGMTDQAPEQKSASWRVNTAGTLLKDFEVDSDLSILQSDNTPQTVARVLHRNGHETDDNLSQPCPKLTLLSKAYDERTVTIESDHVYLVNDLACRNWDLESTLIEVDGSSLINLIVNYRHLIYRGGPALTTGETVWYIYIAFWHLLT